jgi:hypothetical protein
MSDPAAVPTSPDYLAIILSILSLVASVAAVTYTFAWRARPILRVEYSELENNDDSVGNPSWTLWIANRGNGPAYDVRLNVTPHDGNNEVESLGILEAGEQRQLHLMITPFIPIGTDGAGTWQGGSVDPKKVKARLRWRQLPFLGVYRRRTIRPGGKWENLAWTTDEL